MGIRDKKVISIISAMLKAPIENDGIPQKGVPQGGILSPLLANIVLNEFDWWISSQWQTMYSRHEYSNNGKKYRALRNTTLKEIYIIRYADDFKIICKSKNDAEKVFIATKQWLNERLQLEASPEKSKITNVKKNYTEFLGIKIKAVKKNKKRVVKSHITGKAMKKIKNNLKNQIKAIQKGTTIKETNKLNSMIMGIQNYYSIATNVNIDLNKIYYNLRKVIQNRLKYKLSKKGVKSENFKMRYKGYHYKEYNVANITIFPLAAIRTKNPMNFKQNICNYTNEGRELVHQNLNQNYYKILHYLMEHPKERGTLEYNDNRLSKYTAQKGLCAISGEELGKDLEVHHIKPRSQGGTDEYKNLLLITGDIHKLIHATNERTINLYLKTLKINDRKTIEKLNKYRNKVGNNEIKFE